MPARNGNGNGNGSSNLLADWAAAVADEAAANFSRFARLPFLWQQTQRPRTGCTPSDVVYEEDRIKLLRYRSDSPPKYRTPLVFVFALVNRPYILDLKPGKSVISHFIERGFDTYLLDWGIPTDADRFQTLDDHINGYLMNVIQHLREQTGSDQVNILGYCMGGTMSAMFTAQHQELVRTLMLLAAGIDFGSRDGLLQLWTDPSVFDVDRFIKVNGNCPASFPQNAFLLLKPVQNLIEKPINLFERLTDAEYVDDYFTMESWINDNIPVPGETFREFVKYLYQQNRLLNGTMPLGKHVIDLKAITCPVLNLMASKDDLVPCSQSKIFNDLISSTDKRTIEFPAGHIGLAVGSRAQRELWPQACDWLTARTDAAAKARVRR